MSTEDGMITASVDSSSVREFENFIAELEQYAVVDAYLEVGFYDSVIYPNGMNVADVAYINDKGLGVPSRPFFTIAIEKWGEKATKLIADAYHNGMSLEKALGRAGIFMQGKIQDEITDLETPPNAPSTIAIKGSSNPLIDTGLMRRSVSFQVVVDGEIVDFNGG